MSRPVCPMHAHPKDLVCASPSCCTLMCDNCFSLHHAQANHPDALLLDHSSITFFLNFSQHLISVFDRALQLITSVGFKSFFEVKVENGKFAISQQSEAEITKICLEIVEKYKKVLLNNNAFVSDNRDNFALLHHQQFLKDFTVFLLEKWERIGINLAQQLKGELIKTYPYRLTYKHIKFCPRPDILTQIESARNGFLQKIKQTAFVSIWTVKGRAKVDDSANNEARVWEEILTVPHSLKMVDSFQEIMEASYFSCESTDNLKQILEQSVETFSPNFLSSEQMQKQIQLLLIQNQALKQQNYQLRFENEHLRQENTRLKEARAF